MYHSIDVALASGAGEAQSVRRQPIMPVPSEIALQNLSLRLFGFVSGHVPGDLQQPIDPVLSPFDAAYIIARDA